MMHQLFRRSSRGALGLLLFTGAALAIGGSQPAQAAQAVRYAVVAADGSVVAGPAVQSVTVLGVGQYEVRFTSNVSSCAYMATTTNAFSQAVQAYTAGGHLSPKGVYVETKNQGGGLTAAPFNVVVECTRPGVNWAVVDYDGALARASAGTSIGAGGGQYLVTFANNVSGCAYLATVGDPANALVANPANVSTASGPTPNSVLVETKNPAGGLATGIPFHLAAVCPGKGAGDIAVVHADGRPARASALTSSFRTGIGSRNVATGTDLSSCATVASRGSVTSDAPFNPATVEVTPGVAPNTIGLQIRQLLFFGGETIDEAVHAQIVC